MESTRLLELTRQEGNYPMEGLQPNAWTPVRQCTGTSRNGTRCQRNAIPGGNVCIMHGGGAPHVQREAKKKLLLGADLAIDYLLNLLIPKPPCETCGRSDADRDPVVVRACQLVLDRSGFHPTIAVEAAQPNPYNELSEDELIEKLESMLATAKEKRDQRLAVIAYVVPDESVQNEGVQIPSEIEPAGEGTEQNG